MTTIIRWVTKGMMPVMLALGLALTAVGGTLAQEARDTTTAAVSGTGTADASTTADLRGKILRITPMDDPTRAASPALFQYSAQGSH
jgi:hypothetical protein